MKELGSGSVGIVGAEFLPLCQTVYQVAVHGAAAKLPVGGQTGSPFHVFHNPGQFCSGEVRGELKAGSLSHVFGCTKIVFLPHSSYRNPPAYLLSPGALPDDGVIDGFPGISVPRHGGFPLIADSHAGHGFAVHAALLQQLFHHQKRIPVDFFRIVFHPAAFIDQLGVAPVRPVKQVSLFIEQYRLRSLGALVYSYYKFLFHVNSSIAFFAIPSAFRP